jgi:hypothetical protein
MDKEDIEEAIEVLEDASAQMLMETGDENYYAGTIAILRQALVDADDTSQERVDEKAKREQEPVAWITDGGKGELWWYQSSKFDEEGNLIGPNPDDIPLYTASPKREWVGLTDEEIHDLIYLSQKIDASNSPWFDCLGFYRAIESKLKERNT